MERERLGSRLGFILLSAGCAIGIGNVWKFPYIAGQYGGGIFVLIYLFFLVILGIPVMTIEFSLGRASQKSPAKLYQQLEPANSKWHLHGYASVIGNYLLMMFYTTVAGWMIRYFVSIAKGDLKGLDTNGVSDFYTTVTADYKMMIVYLAIVVISGFLVCSLGLANGLEKVTKVMMIALLGIMMVLAINSIFLDGGKEGLSFYLKPDLKKMESAGAISVIVAAMNQAFFTLSLGMGAMAIFGSYLNKDRALLGESINIAVLDTFVAFVSGLIIFPACSAYDVPVDSGPNLIFVTLPNVFNGMRGGRIWGSLFFVFMSFASLSTVFAVFEGILACTCDIFGWSRKKSCLINGILVFVLSLPCVFGFNKLSFVKFFGGKVDIMGLEDFLVSNLLLPIGSLIFVLFCVTKKGWGWDNFVKEANSGEGRKVTKWMKGYMTYVLPVIILIVFVFELYNFFEA